MEKVGGWDEYNVKEDEDIGMRLERFGYRIDVIRRGKIEDEKEEKGVWKRKRKRWIKGWMKKWMVNGRKKMKKWREIGWWSLVVRKIYKIGIIG